MKRICPLTHALLLFSAFACLPALASASTALSQADATFLRSLGQEGTLAAPAIGSPAPNLLSNCNISKTCQDGATVSCMGTFSCVLTILGVSCDNHETRCPQACSISQQCANGVITCFSTRGDCGYAEDGNIECNGREWSCGHS